MRSYEAARKLHSFLAFCAALLIIGGMFIGAGAALVASQADSFGRGASFAAIALAAMPGIAMIIAGFLALAMVQNGRATVDTAELTQQMLQATRDHLDVSRQAVTRSQDAKESYEALVKAMETNTATARALATSYADAAVAMANPAQNRPNGASAEATPALEARQDVPVSYATAEREPVAS